jgi:hypothetical protein
VSCHLHVPIASFEGSYALLSSGQDAGTAIVFVHGFFGDAWTTWEEFQSLVDDDHGGSLWPTADLYFYEYRAASNFIAKSAQDLLGFLEAVYPNPNHGLFWSPPHNRFGIVGTNPLLSIRQPPIRYRRLLLVGHSLGSPVLRQVIAGRVRSLRQAGQSVDAFPRWLKEAELYFFAPAHRGFRPSSWKALLTQIPGWGKYLGTIPLFWRAYSDVQQGSELLSDLRDRTQTLVSQYPTLRALRATSMFGALEDLVEPLDYDDDFELRFVDGVGHTDVCKPRVRFKPPLEFLSNAPRNRAAGV